MRPDGTDARQETFSPGFDGFPSVSPDGSTLAYEYSDDADPGVRTGAGPAAAKASRAGRVHRLRRAIRRELSGAAYVADRR